jgi:hypothetical protein
MKHLTIAIIACRDSPLDTSQSKGLKGIYALYKSFKPLDSEKFKDGDKKTHQIYIPKFISSKRIDM